jgi:hypothetical protein
VFEVRQAHLLHCQYPCPSGHIVHKAVHFHCLSVTVTPSGRQEKGGILVSGSGGGEGCWLDLRVSVVPAQETVTGQ